MSPSHWGFLGAYYKIILASLIKLRVILLIISRIFIHNANFSDKATCKSAGHLRILKHIYCLWSGNGLTKNTKKITGYFDLRHKTDYFDLRYKTASEKSFILYWKDNKRSEHECPDNLKLFFYWCPWVTKKQLEGLERQFFCPLANCLVLAYLGPTWKDSLSTAFTL